MTHPDALALAAGSLADRIRYEAKIRRDGPRDWIASDVVLWNDAEARSRWLVLVAAPTREGWRVLPLGTYGDEVPKACDLGERIARRLAGEDHDGWTQFDLAVLDDVTRADLYRGLAALARATGMEVG